MGPREACSRVADFRLGPAAVEAGFSVQGFDSVDSTNLRALGHARSGGADRTWFASLEQTAGRGRRGRNWVSKSGNLAATVLLSAATGQSGLANLGFVAGAATHATLAEVLGTHSSVLKLKWPNDVLFDGQKTVGILIEAESGRGRTNLALGIGINVAHVPEGLPYQATSLRDIGVEVRAEDVFTVLSDQFAHWLTVWDQGDGLAAVLDYWRNHAAGMGERVVVRQTNGAFEGLFEKLDDEGRLIVQMDDGERRVVTAADVFLAGITPNEAAEERV